MRISDDSGSQDSQDSPRILRIPSSDYIYKVFFKDPCDSFLQGFFKDSLDSLRLPEDSGYQYPQDSPRTLGIPSSVYSPRILWIS